MGEGEGVGERIWPSHFNLISRPLSVTYRAASIVINNDLMGFIFVLGQYESVAAYLDYIGNHGVFADNAIISATARALGIQVAIINSRTNNTTTFYPESGDPSQTVYLGYIQDYHYVSTESLSEPVSFQYGGVTSDGSTLEGTDVVDNDLAWFFNFLDGYEDIRKHLEKSSDDNIQFLIKHYPKKNTIPQADLKASFLRNFDPSIKTGLQPVINITGNRKIKSISDILKDSGLAKFCGKRVFQDCAKCKGHVAGEERFHLDMDTLLNGQMENAIPCISCGDVIPSQEEITIASPFMIIPGDGRTVRSYPEHIKLKISSEELNYDTSYFLTQSHSQDYREHISSFLKNNGVWFKNDRTNLKPLTRHAELPDDPTLMVLFVIYVCSAALKYSVTEKRIRKRRKKIEQPPKKKDAPPPKKKNKTKQPLKNEKFDMTKNLRIRDHVELVRTCSISQYIEYDRKKFKVPGKCLKYIQKLTKDIKENGLHQPIVLSVSKKSEKAFIHEGHHRLMILNDAGVPWVPVKIIYYFPKDDNDPSYNYIPTSMHGKWPDYPKPSLLGFETRSIE